MTRQASSSLISNFPDHSWVIPERPDKDEISPHEESEYCLGSSHSTTWGTPFFSLVLSSGAISSCVCDVSFVEYKIGKQIIKTFPVKPENKTFSDG